MRRITCLLFLTVAAFAYGDDLPEGVKNSQNPKDVSLTPAESLKRIKVPAGFKVTLFAGEPDIRRPIAFDIDDRGRLWVVENYSHPNWKKDNQTDRIIILEDVDNDGSFDKRTVFWDKGRYLTGIALGHGGVWVANTPELVFIPDRNGDDRPDSEPVPVLDGFQLSSNNVVNNLHWGPDGWLYGAIGLSKPSFVGKPGSPKEQRTRISRGMWRFHPQDHRFEKIAEGMVNPWGADFNEYGDLFTTNTVIAHLWHIVPGMYCQRRGSEQDNRYSYGRIQSITDHLHWGGGRWQASRSVEDRHSVAGGGHAHCGAMVYLGDNWPDKYRGTFFTLNLHGNRVNNDRLVPRNSSYVGVHSDDFFFANDPWFRGLSIKYGPDGGVYITDWHDFGECHDNDGSHRTSGRIYKVVYGSPKSPMSLADMKDRELVELLQHKNEWYVRHARRLLHERALSNKLGADVSEALRKRLSTTREVTQQLRYLWTLFVIGQLDEPTLSTLLGHSNEHLRRWAVRLLTDRQQPSAKVRKRLVDLSRTEPSAKVRLALAVAIPKLPSADRWGIAEGLLSHEEDQEDAYLPLITWYGIEPEVGLNPERAMNLFAECQIPQLRQFIIRRVLDTRRPDIQRVVRKLEQLKSEAVLSDGVEGMLQALKSKGSHRKPDGWDALAAKLQAAKDAQLRTRAVQLAVLFGDRQAIGRLQKTLADDDAKLKDRQRAMKSLLGIEKGIPMPLLHRLVSGPVELSGEAIRALILQNSPETADVLIKAYKGLDDEARQNAISVLVTRQSFADQLLQAIEEKRIDRGDVSAFSLQQLRSFRSPVFVDKVTRIWPKGDTRLAKSSQIARYQKLLTASYLKTGDVHAGRRLFDKTCSKCHRLFGEGGNIGPDLTGSGRQKVDYVLSNLIDPSAIVDSAYRLTQVITGDGRVLRGFMVRLEEKHLVLRTQDAVVRIALDDVDEMKTTNTSMMPEGMISSLSDEEVRDLVRYLASPYQVAPQASEQ